MKRNSPIRSLELALGLPIQAYGLLLILGGLTWAGVVHSGHVTFDTEWLWRENTILSSGELRWLGTIWSDFSPDVRQMLGAEYLPVRDTNTLIDFKLFGDNWTLHHGANLFWYLAAWALAYPPGWPPHGFLCTRCTQRMSPGSPAGRICWG